MLHIYLAKDVTLTLDTKEITTKLYFRQYITIVLKLCMRRDGTNCNINTQNSQKWHTPKINRNYY